MTEELGKIEKPAAEEFKNKRRLLYVPLIYGGQEAPAEYLERCERYWFQAEEQLENLEIKLGRTTRIYHEFVPVSGEPGAKTVEDLNKKAYDSISKRLVNGAQIEATEDNELLTEVMDWSRCLASGLQNQKVFDSIYKSYTKAIGKRNEYITARINETLGEDETGLLFMREGHQLQLPGDIEVFYVTPPALDEIKRWLREYETKSGEEKGDSE